MSPYDKCGNIKEIMSKIDNTYALTNTTTMNTSSTEGRGTTNRGANESSNIQPSKENKIPTVTPNGNDRSQVETVTKRCQQ